MENYAVKASRELGITREQARDELVAGIKQAATEGKYLVVERTALDT